MERPAEARTGRGGFGARREHGGDCPRADLRPNQIYRWRRQIEQAAQSFAEVQVQADLVPVTGSAITVEFARAIVRIPAGASPGLASAVLRSVKP
ncbi:hypothetical protein [Sphingobium sp. TomTYG75]